MRALDLIDTGARRRALTAGIFLTAATFARAQETGAPPVVPYQVELQAARKAETTHDLAAARRHYLAALPLIHGHPDVVYYLARTEARLGNAEAAIARLRTIAAMGLSYPVEQDTTLNSLHTRPDFARVAAAMAANRTSIGQGSIVRVIADTDALTEDLAYDRPHAAFLVSSVHRGLVMTAPAHGPSEPWFTLPNAGFAAMALAIDTAHGTLWATMSGVPHASGYQPADSEQSTLLAIDLATGHLRRRYDVPRDGHAHDLGDMTVGVDGTIIVSDGPSGAVYRLRPGGDALGLLVAPGTFRSPQTPAFISNARVLVPDYALGLAVVDLATGRIAWIEHPETTALSGIDGAALRDHDLYAVQNGVSPERVVRIRLDDTFTRVVDLTVIERASERLGEPTHGIIVGDAYYFIANSGWDRFRDDGSIARRGKPPIIVRVPLD